MCISHPGYSRTRICYFSSAGKKYRHDNGQQMTKSSNIYCVNCNRTIAPAEEQINIKEGPVHYACALEKAVEKLVKAGLPRPTNFSTPADFRRYLVEQVKRLLYRPFDDVKDQLAAIQEVAQEIFGKDIFLSKLMAR